MLIIRVIYISHDWSQQKQSHSSFLLTDFLHVCHKVFYILDVEDGVYMG